MASILPLALQLLPLIPPAVKGVTDLINTILRHPETPEEARAQLAEISAQLDDVAAKVAAVKV